MKANLCKSFPQYLYIIKEGGDWNCLRTNRKISLKVDLNYSMFILLLVELIIVKTTSVSKSIYCARAISDNGKARIL